MWQSDVVTMYVAHTKFRHFTFSNFLCHLLPVCILRKKTRASDATRRALPGGEKISQIGPEIREIWRFEFSTM